MKLYYLLSGNAIAKASAPQPILTARMQSWLWFAAGKLTSMPYNNQGRAMARRRWP